MNVKMINTIGRWLASCLLLFMKMAGKLSAALHGIFLY